MKRRFSQGWLLLLAVVSAVFCGLLPVRGQAATPAALIQQGQAEYHQGHFDRAIATWKWAERAYQSDPEGIAGSRINQAQALIAMGQQRHACKLLVATLYRHPNTNQLCEFANSEVPDLQPTLLPAPLAVMGVDKLAEALRQVGNLEEAEMLLRRHWIQTPLTAQPALLLNLGNILRDLGTRDRDRTEQLDLTAVKPSNCLGVTNSNPTAASFYSQAIACYQAAAASNLSTVVQLQANLNYLSLLADLQQWASYRLPKTKSIEFISRFPQIEALIESIQSQLQTLPSQVERFFIQLNFAHTLTLIRNTQNEQFNEIEPLIHQAIADANSWNNQRLSILSIGELGWFYEHTNRLPEALKQTESALKLTRSIEVARLHPQDLTYQWEWQRGRILRRLGQNQDAIVAYENAIKALESVREQVLGVNPDAQFALRDNIEPIYRELIDLLLPVGQPVSQETLKSVLEYLDALQLAELQNFLRCRIEVTKEKQGNPVRDRSAAFVYSIILPDRLEVLLEVAQQPLQRRPPELIEQTQLNQVLQQILQDMRRGANSDEPNPISVQQRSSEQLYSWLIRDFKPVLEQNSIKTLVFVSDGLLRSIPMAALYDAQKSEYLIDQYAIGVTPGSLVLGAKEDKHQQKKALIAGLTTLPPTNLPIRNMHFSFDLLENVETEIRGIQNLLPQSNVMVGKDFTPTNFRTKFNSSYYQIVHLASHGYFSSDPRQTFILMDAGQYILVDELQRLVRNRQDMRPEPIELMVLSACQTATGDRRSTLGLAGTAIRAGADSTLASLWSVNDASTAEMMQAFYQVLTQSQQPVTKAEALRQAQLKIRTAYKLPYNWAPFVLVGNWL